jgi:hypothetical protein
LSRTVSSSSRSPGVLRHSENQESISWDVGGLVGFG